MIGQILGHYRVIDQLGAGGMGVVYRAHDEQLDRNVALKVLPSGLLADEDARKRFRKEALALAKLNHPNVETIYEFGSQNGIDFLAMELIPGVPLNEKLKSGPLPERDLMRFGLQLADGLAAAHEQGVIHSDLKPANIFITNDNRLKILDFGLARLLKTGEDNDVTQTITAQSGAIGGTLPYMSPEQLRAEPIDARSDIYAAGAVLYEMATGKRPFAQNQAAQLIGAILHTEPPPPGTVNQNIQPGAEAVIMKALDKSPSERYQTAREFRTALETLSTNPFVSSRALSQSLQTPVSVVTPTNAVAVPSRWAPKTAIIGGAMAIVAIIAVAILLAFDVGRIRSKLFHSSGADASSTSPPAGPLPARHAVAVLSLVNTSKQPEQAWLATTLQQMLETELGAGGNVRVISGEDVARMKSELALPGADSYGRETLEQIQKNLGADDVVTGSYIAPGNGELRLDLRLQDAHTGETLAPVSVTGRSGQMSDLVTIASSAGVQLREKLGIEGAPPMADASLKASMPANPEAAQLYAQGIERLHAFDALGAVDPLQKAIKKDPNHALAHSALAEAWSALGYDERAKEEDGKALTLAGSLSSEDRGVIQGRLYEFSSQWDKAATYYLSLHTLSQDDIEYGLREANAQTRGENPKAALATIAELRATPGPAGQDPRIDLAEADAAEMMGDFKEEETAAARAADKANQLGMRRVAADAEWHRCTALVNQGESAAKTQCEKARDAARAVDDPLLEARSLTGLGYALSDQGAMDQALDCHQQALKLVQGIGAQRDIAGALLNIGNLKYASGNLKEANDYYHRSLTASQLINNTQGILDAEGGLAPDLYASGEYGAAQQIYGAMLKTARDAGDKKNSAFALNGTALVLFQLGDLNGSLKYIDDALHAANEAGMKADRASWLCSLGDIQLAEDRLDLAGKTYDEALGSSEQLGATSGVARANVALANLALEKKDAAKSESLARQAADIFHKAKDADSEADALNSVAQALLAENKLPDARKAIDAARNLPAQDQAIRLSLATTAAQVDALEGKSAEALQALDAVIAKTKEIKAKKKELQARLAKVTVQHEATKTPTALQDLKRLQADASAAGFLLVAGHAAELVSRPSPNQ